MYSFSRSNATFSASNEARCCRSVHRSWLDDFQFGEKKKIQFPIWFGYTTSRRTWSTEFNFISSVLTNSNRCVLSSSVLSFVRSIICCISDEMRKPVSVTLPCMNMLKRYQPSNRFSCAFNFSSRSWCKRSTLSRISSRNPSKLSDAFSK